MTAPMHDDQDMDSAVRGWMHDDDGPPADRNRRIGRIMGRVDETKQRRRLWPLNPFGRRAVHSATGADEALHTTRGRVGALAPARAVTAVALAILVTAGLLWVVAQPREQPPLPGGLMVDPADKQLFERFAGLWAGPETDDTAVLDTYAEDAVGTILWHDKIERISGARDIWSRMRQEASVEDPADWIPLPPTDFGQHRYLSVTSDLGGIPCVYWISSDRIRRHDCIMPMSSTDLTIPDFAPPRQSAASDREALLPTFSQGWGYGDRDKIEQVVSPDILHHVAYDNHGYALEGIAEYMSVTGYGMAVELVPAIDLPAPEGEMRWINFSTVAGGTLCTFWSRDGYLIRHDCVLPIATVPRSVAEPIGG